MIKIKTNIEKSFDISIPIISGGNSSSVTLFGKKEIPAEINHLRLGESILFGKETSYSKNIPGLNHDVFELEAEIICTIPIAIMKIETTLNCGLNIFFPFTINPTIR